MSTAHLLLIGLSVVAAGFAYISLVGFVASTTYWKPMGQAI